MGELKKRFELTLIDYGEDGMGIEFKDFILKRGGVLTPDELGNIQDGSHADKYRELLNRFKRELRVILTEKKN